MDRMRDAEPDPMSHLALVTLAVEPIAVAVAERLAALFPQSRLSQHSDLRRAAEDHPASRIVLAVISPVEAVARRLAEGAGVLDALADWIAETAPSLAAARHHRRRLWLIEARAMAAGLVAGLPHALSTAEATGSGVELPALPETMYLVLADSLIARHEPAMRLAAEIASLRRGPQGVTIDLAMIVDALNDDSDAQHRLTGLQAALANMQADRDQLTAEVDLLRENLLLQLTDADVAARMRAALKAEADTLSKAAAERHFFKSEAEALARRLEDNEESRLSREAVLGSMLLADQADLAARLSASSLASDAMGRRIVELEAAQEVERLKAEAFQAELQHVYASNSWKVTGPLRGARLWIGP